MVIFKKSVYIAIERFYVKKEWFGVHIKEKFYELKQAPRHWSKKFVLVIVSFGFVKKVDDLCI